MKVSAQYAQEHFPDILMAASNGEEVEISLPGQPSLVLVQSPTPVPFKRTTPRILGAGRGEMRVPDFEEWQTMDAKMEREMCHDPLTSGEDVIRTTPERPRSELFGSLRDKIGLADDWDSPATNKEIENLFENSAIFPNVATCRCE